MNRCQSTQQSLLCPGCNSTFKLDLNRPRTGRSFGPSSFFFGGMFSLSCYLRFSIVVAALIYMQRQIYHSVALVIPAVSAKSRPPELLAMRATNRKCCPCAPSSPNIFRRNPQSPDGDHRIACLAILGAVFLGRYLLGAYPLQSAANRADAFHIAGRCLINPVLSYHSRTAPQWVCSTLACDEA